MNAPELTVCAQDGKTNEKRHPRTIVSFAVLVFSAFLAGCQNQVLLSPKGEVGMAERDLILLRPALCCSLWYPSSS